ncbi:unknown (plasmid) [Haloarcula marismortui ATCC 43049]|uniref:Uncharacterized protein n=1 Tax=Haloarcula marismortui (strain ATCC 43049 / DSM 3752 / JCM 8966 / VKM B-1809) TaxID=272569 RepID=Q5V810_HALMA|nr:unknown [Haloarcula marismortui ATCC 43049]
MSLAVRSVVNLFTSFQQEFQQQQRRQPSDDLRRRRLGDRQDRRGADQQRRPVEQLSEVRPAPLQQHRQHVELERPEQRRRRCRCRTRWVGKELFERHQLMKAPPPGMKSSAISMAVRIADEYATTTIANTIAAPSSPAGPVQLKKSMSNWTPEPMTVSTGSPIADPASMSVFAMTTGTSTSPRSPSVDDRESPKNT